MTYKILICDHMNSYRMMAREALKNSEYCVIAETDNGKEAIELYAEHHPDLILLSITMPKMDGITILKKILEIDKEAIVVMHAALGQQAQADKCIKRGAKGVVFKPYPSKRLLEALKNALS